MVDTGVERDVTDETASQREEQGLTVGETMRIVLVQATGCGPDFGR